MKVPFVIVATAILQYITRKIAAANAKRICWICGSSDCNRKGEGPWHPAPPPGGWGNEPRNPPKGGMTFKDRGRP